MNQMSRRAQNRLEKQERILSAAMTVFARAGYSGASMEMIAAEAGLTKPTLYQYYPGKEELFAEMMRTPRDLMLLAFDSANGKDHVEQLLEFAWAYARTVMRKDLLSLARLIIGEAHRFPDIGREYQRNGPDKVLAGLMAFMEQERDRGHLSFDDAELAAEDFWGLILSAPRNRALHIPDEDIGHAILERYIHNGLRVFLKAYSVTPERDRHRLERVVEGRTRDLTLDGRRSR